MNIVIIRSISRTTTCVYGRGQALRQYSSSHSLLYKYFPYAYIRSVSETNKYFLITGSNQQSFIKPRNRFIHVSPPKIKQTIMEKFLNKINNFLKGF